MLEVAVLPASWVVTVIVTVPAVLPVTKPVELTVAIDVLLELHETVLLVAVEGLTVAVN
jgi:hypothetical protein